MRNDPPQVDFDRECWRERVRQMPGVVVRGPRQPISYEPDIQAINVRHFDELIGDDDEQGDACDPDL